MDRLPPPKIETRKRTEHWCTLRHNNILVCPPKTHILCAHRVLTNASTVLVKISKAAATVPGAAALLYGAAAIKGARRRSRISCV